MGDEKLPLNNNRVDRNYLRHCILIRSDGYFSILLNLNKKKQFYQSRCPVK